MRPFAIAIIFMCCLFFAIYVGTASKRLIRDVRAATESDDLRVFVDATKDIYPIYPGAPNFDRNTRRSSGGLAKKLFHGMHFTEELPKEMTASARPHIESLFGQLRGNRGTVTFTPDVGIRIASNDGQYDLLFSSVDSNVLVWNGRKYSWLSVNTRSRAVTALLDLSRERIAD